MNYGTLLLAASLGAALAASVPPKIARGGGHFADSRNQLEERATAFLTGHGYTLRGSADVSLDGHYHLLAFTSAPLTRGGGADGCTPGMLVGAVPVNGEAGDMLRRVLGHDVPIRYLHDGRLHDEPPVLAAYVKDKLHRVLSIVGAYRGVPGSVLLAVVEDRACPAPAPLPWDHL